MTYTPRFTRPPQGNYDPDKAFTQIRAGSEAYLLEDEVNEMQAILQEQARSVARDLYRDGLKERLVVKRDTSRANVYRIAPFEVMADGVSVRVTGINTTGTPRTEADGEDNLILIPAPPFDSEEERYDPVLLEVFEEEVHAGQTLYRHGAQSSDFTIPNDLCDNRVGAETSRRMQMKSVLRVVEDDLSDWQYDLNGSPLTHSEGWVFRSAAGRTVIWLFTLAYLPGQQGNEHVFEMARLSSLRDSVIPSGFINTQKLAYQAVTSDKMAPEVVTAEKLSNGAVTSSKLAANAVKTTHLENAVVTVDKIGTNAVTTSKIADGQVTIEKLANTAMNTLNDRMGLSVPSDGFIPILRFFQWWSAIGNFPVKWAGGHSAAEWGSQVLQKEGQAWKVFEGITYMSRTHATWQDKKIHMYMGNAGALADNVSMYCLQNITNTTASVTPNANYSSYAGQNAAASASVAYKVFDPAGKPELTDNFTETVTLTTTNIGSGGWTVQVPAGHVMIFILKSSPYLSSGNLYYNMHELLAPISQMPNFAPHLPTYRRLLNGKWD
ncbi:hypothetical protein EV586_102434 [Tumebacillus sp. BK434]|uniref:hypothetical protein n=1 Tax=Tumebacillus sp. BK434 TaxID=2512169 RepID=UPI001051F967|nr:hypothetical protein [Tumebacillus sp. BK434]TCP57986.1 hypothetical protein EV586_102434 [Tumebacillus sp. BK434]